MTNTLLANSARNILREALASDTGLVIEIRDPTGTVIAPATRAKQTLYRFMQENADYSNLQIRISPDDPDRELWIIKSRE